MTEGVVQRDPVERLAEEFMARLRRGERPALSEYTTAHPELEAEIRDLFPALVMMEEVKQAGTEDPAAAAAGAECPPEQLGDYRILREVARGGMGVVYEAEQVALGRHVALKVLPGRDGGDPLRLLRFRREARSAARLHHTNIVPVFDVGMADGVHYYAMQFIRGQGLDEVLQELRRLRSGERPTDAPVADLTGSLAEGLLTGEFLAAPFVPVPRPAGPRTEPSAILTGPVAHYSRSVARLSVQAADALAYAHGQRVLHRDVKPSNLLLDLQGTLWLTDFGLAKDDTEDLTRTGDIVGTLRYMAPERFQGVSEPRSDVYALGVTLYELLTLRPAFVEADRVRLIHQIANEGPPKPRAIDPTIPRDLETVVLKAIEKDPARRYATAADMAEDLRRFLSDRPIKARRASWREQAWRWCRRNPGVAGSLSAAFALLVLLVIGLSVGGYLIWRAKQDVEGALAEEKQAAYCQRIALADREFAVNHTARAEELLAQCPAELRRWEWHYLNRSRGRPAPALRHPHPLTGKAAVSPDGRWLATAGRNGVVTVWDLTAPDPTQRHIKAHDTSCWNVAFTPDSRVLFSVNEVTEKPGVRAEVRFWDPATGADARPGWDLGRRFVNALAFSPDGRQLARTTWRAEPYEDVVEVCDPMTGEVRRTLGAHAGGCMGLAFSPDGSLLVSAAEKTVRVYEADTGRVVYEYCDPGPGNPGFSSAAFSRDGRRLAAGYGNENEKEPGGTRVWEVGAWRDPMLITGHDVFSVAWGPDGRLATGGADGTVRVWDVSRGLELLTLHGHADVAREVVFTPDGHRLLSASDDRLVRVWDATPLGTGAPPGDELATLTGHTNCVKPVTFHPTEPVLVSGDTDGRVLAWDARSWSAAPRLLFSGEKSIQALAYDPNGKWLAVAGGGAADCVILSVRDGAARTRLQLEGGFRPHRLSFSPDSRFVAGCDVWGTVVVWDASTGRSRPVGHPPNYLYGVAFHPSPGRPLLAVASTGQGVPLIDPTTGREVTLLDHPDATGLAFSPDGARLASVGWNDVVKVWRTDTWALADQYRDPSGRPNSVAFSPDGTLLAWGGMDTTVKVWKVGTDRVATLRGHRNWVWDVAFRPKTGDVIASAGRDGTVKIWKTPTFGAK